MDDLRSASLLRVPNLGDGWKLVIADYNLISIASEVQGTGQGAHGVGDGGHNGDLVGLGPDEAGKCIPGRLHALDP